MKVGMVSSYPPLNDSIGKVYTHNLIKNCSANFVKIGCRKSKSDYVVNFKSFFLKNNIKEIVKKEKLNLLHIQYIAPLYGKYTLNLNVLPLYKLKIPIVTTLHEVQYPHKGGPIYKGKRKVLEYIEKRIVKNSKKIIVHTDSQKEFLKQKYKAKNVEVIHTGLYCKKNNPKKYKNLIFFGFISPGKGIENLIRAMKHLNQFKLIIAGSTPNGVCKKHLRKIRKEIKRNKVKNKIKTITADWIPDPIKEEIYRKSSIAVVPYTWGPYNSGIVQDAAEYNLPVVITKVGAIYDVVKKYGTGEIIKPNSVVGIVKGVKKVYSNFEKYKKGIRIYRKEANWKKTGKKHLMLYKSLLGGRR